MIRQVALCVILIGLLQPGIHALNDVCDNFNPAVSSIFREGCRAVLSDILAKNIYDDCVFFRDHRPARLNVFLMNINMICNFKNYPICRDVVFMIHSGNSVGLGKFNKFKQFTKGILDDMCINPSQTGNFVSLMTFSTSFTIETSIDSLTFERGGVTNTHLAIERMNEILDERRTKPGRKRCLQVGVMLLHFLSTNWPATLTELIKVNKKRDLESLARSKNHEEVRIIAVGVDNARNNFDTVEFQSQLKSIATGFECDNVKMVTDFNSLPTVSNDVFKMIAAPRTMLQESCTQYAAVGTTADYLGVFELVRNGMTCSFDSGRSIQPIFEHVTDDTWILANVQGPPIPAGHKLWTVQKSLPSSANNPCVANREIRAFSTVFTPVRDPSTPDRLDRNYKEFTPTGFQQTQMQFKCFNHQVLDYAPQTCRF